MYTSIVGSFLNSIQALRFYVDSVEPNSLKMGKDVDNNSIIALLMWATKELKVSNKNLEDLDLPEDMPKDIAKFFKEAMQGLEKFFDVSEDGKGGRYKSVPKELKEAYREVEAIQRQKEILYSGSLMLLITYFENTISKILRTDLRRHPKRMSLETKTVPYKVLEMSESIDDVKEILIENEVSLIMYKSVSDWIDYFRKNMKVNMDYVTERLPDLIEIIARRNLIVHNEGVVNTTYLRLVSEKYAEKVKIGDRLIVNKKYIDEAVSLVETLGMAIIVEVWLKESSKNQDEVDKILAIIFDEFLIFERWENAKILYEICLKNKLQNADELTCKINKWQCYKWLDQFDLIKNEVEELDVSACKPRYTLGVLALLDKYEEFFEYFDLQDDITNDELEEWPLFKGVRESQIYKERYDIKSLECIEE